MSAARSSVSLVGTALAMAALVTACGAPLPTPPGSGETPAPAPTSDATRGVLIVQARDPDGCGAIGGCAWFVRIDGVHDTWGAELEAARGGGVLLAGDRLPAIIPEGRYTVTFWGSPVSDLVTNGERSMGPAFAECATDLIVPGGSAVTILASFDDRTCEIEVRAGASQ